MLRRLCCLCTIFVFCVERMKRVMACTHVSDTMVFLNHKVFVDNIYSLNKFFDENIEKAFVKTDLFCIAQPYDRKFGTSEHNFGEPKPKKRKKAENVDETTAKVQRNHARFLQIMERFEVTNDTQNSKALELVNDFNKQDCYEPNTTFKGANPSNFAVICKFFNQSYLIPPHCRFFNSDISNLENLLDHNERFDLIVLDPPWWNKYIRRTKAVNGKIGYNMLDNESIENIPLENYIHNDSIVIIWCTNAPTHMNAIKGKFLKKWKLRLLCKWFWVKITTNGEPVCSFKESNKKQPYEQIFVATSENNAKWNLPPERFIYSVPSAFHSNKPPLIDLFSDLLPEHPKCLEIFARNTYPNFTSIGSEVLKLQNAKLFEILESIR
ncbi:N(6)-adenine-specific methyltransferase METTL4 [Topomyia yanbarensis]|uniref:N(6)-adenine-specific methyltransferase METTL4 n=1 Tax=Topomyia yanbarensis TaxID=2498891 RepID=UPI00273BC0A3|nr:N(6)-adenine-specific methyltransferase METTL4 [Topomyia yanbarensis]